LDPQLIIIKPLPEKRIQTLSSTFGKDSLQEVLNEYLNLPSTPFVSLVAPILLEEPLHQEIPEPNIIGPIIVDQQLNEAIPEGT
jgi:hypothetical protein